MAAKNRGFHLLGNLNSLRNLPTAPLVWVFLLWLISVAHSFEMFQEREKLIFSTERFEVIRLTSAN